MANANESDEARQEVVEKGLLKYRETDCFAAVEYVCTVSDPVLSVQSFSALMRHCYWKQKDLTAALVFGRAGAQHGVMMAAILAKKDPKKAAVLRALAKGFTYDIASFTWPGWNEKGIEISEEALAEGLQAAHANLRLAIQLKKDPLAMSRAYWMLGAQQLAVGRMKSSGETFLKAAAEAKKAGSRAEEVLGESFVCLTEVLAETENKASTGRLHGLLAELRKQKDGSFFADQVDTALEVFARKKE